MKPDPKVKEFTQFHHLDDLGGLQMLQARYHHQEFSRHIHDTFCIAVIEEGAQKFQRNGREYIAPKGDIILVHAEDVHTGSSAVEDGWAYQAIYPHPELLKSLSAGLKGEQGFVPWFPNAVLSDPGLAEQLRLLFQILTQEKNILLKQTLLCSSLTWLICQYGKDRLTNQPLRSSEQAILRVRDLMYSMPSTDFSLLQLAQMAQLSPWHFLRQFKKTVGLAPHAYLVQIRLHQAKKMLQEGRSITDVANACGFSDQSHFHRHFKYAIGVTPGAYIRGLNK